jgi:HD-like signal output (HDOD) protein
MLLHHQGIAKAIEALEPLPATAGRLAALLNRQDWELAQVEEAISLDQALTPRLLSLANSALMARGREIATVRDAVVRLGAQHVVQVAMSVGLRKRFAVALPCYGLADGQLWNHGVAAALAAQLLVDRRRALVPPEAFTASLMHDVGKLVLARFLDAGHAAALREAQEAGTPLRATETEILGIDHAEVGAAVVAHWKLPERLRVAVQHHHTPADTEDPLASAVHIADVIGHRAVAAVIGVLGNEADVVPDQVALDRLSMTPRDLDQLVVAVGNELIDVLRRYA